jgi:hypothetical protein
MAVQIATGVLLGVDDERAEAARWISICDEGAGNADECYARMALALIQHPQKPAGLPLPEVLDLMPSARREAVNIAIEEWFLRNYGRTP